MRAIEPADRPLIIEFLTRHWGGPIVLLDGRAIDVAGLPGFVDGADTAITGLITLLDGEGVGEIVTLNAVDGRKGLGTRLVDQAVDRAGRLGQRNLTVRTTNDNLDALRFYQRRGFRLHRLAAGAIDEERRLNPEVPTNGHFGISVRDEITLLRKLTPPM